ncbi:site-2 protease family protein [Candidatus Woesearchaeota archaeon]|nr:site-2 protease family protein [Candidatus Woesearchaeota archaeon]
MRKKYYFEDSKFKYKVGNFLTSSDIELKDISKAWFAISLAFGIVLGGFSVKFFPAFIISAVAVGLGFLLHELSHKYFAQKYGYKAEFRSFDEMLFLAIIMSFFGFVIAAPGAVVIFSRVLDIKKNGIISVAGPIMNIFIALAFLLLGFIITGNLELFSLPIPEVLELNLGLAIIAIGFLVNSWLALFNMIPLWLFDGAKVFRWNKIIWFLVVFIAAFLVFGI